jgi:hypothetical protein
MNLLEPPVLFYVVCLPILDTGGASTLMLTMAWAFVALRVVHSAIHLTYNKVMRRMGVFGLSDLALIVLWVLAVIQVASHT